MLKVKAFVNCKLKEMQLEIIDAKGRVEHCKNMKHLNMMLQWNNRC